MEHTGYRVQYGWKYYTGASNMHRQTSGLSPTYKNKGTILY